MVRVEAGHYVIVRYTGRIESGEVFDTNEGGPALELQAGAGQVIPGLDRALLGMAPGEKKSITLPPEQAYGKRDDSLRRSLPRSEFPPDAPLKAGEVMALKTADGARVPVEVHAVDDQEVVLDFNHPLAGHTLSFDLEVVAINTQPTQPSACAVCTGDCGRH